MLHAFLSSRSTWRAVDLIHGKGGVRKIGELFKPDVQELLAKLPIREAGWMAISRELVKYTLDARTANGRQQEIMVRRICRAITQDKYPIKKRKKRIVH